MFIYCSSLILKLRGETGIRTPDTLLGYTRFPGVPLQPLEHLSFSGRKSRGSFRIYQMFGINNQPKYIIFDQTQVKSEKSFDNQI